MKNQKGMSSLMDMKKVKTSSNNSGNPVSFVQTQNIQFSNSSKANYRDRANKMNQNPTVFAEKSGFSVNSPFLSKTLKGMLGGPVATTSKQSKKTSVQR